MVNVVSLGVCPPKGSQVVSEYLSPKENSQSCTEKRPRRKQLESLEQAKDHEHTAPLT